MKMKASNIALSVLALLLLTSMVWVNTRLEKVYSEIDLTDKLRNYLPLQTDNFKILKISGSNGYPIEIQKGDKQEVRVLRSRVSQFKVDNSGDTLMIEFTGARVSPAALPETTTPAGMLITSDQLTELFLTNTHNRISGFYQRVLALQLSGESYTEFAGNRLDKLSIMAHDASSFEFGEENVADTAVISMKHRSVAFLDGLSYHKLQPEMEDSALVVLSKNALMELVKK